MNTFAKFLFVAATTAVSSASSTVLRGSSTVVSVPEDQRQRRRHLTEETTCKLYLRDVEYADEPTGRSERTKRRSEESWICQFSEEDAAKLGVHFVDIVDPRNVVVDAQSGVSTMTVSEALLDTVEPRMYIPEAARVFVREDDMDSRQEVRRQLSPTQGTMNTLVVRVSTLDSKVTANAAQLRRDVFEDDVCLKSQYERCSYGKFKINKYNGKIADGTQVNGVLDVQLNYRLSDNASRGNLQNEAFSAALKAVGTFENNGFDLVMFCMPPGTSDAWAAYALIRNKFSYYNNDWCSYVSAQMHEVGHNIGLAHSSELGQGEYDDQTGFMGYSYKANDQYMCFNPAKNFQLGWYSNKIMDYNPLKSSPSTQTFVLNGVNDYTKNPNAKISIRLEQANKVQDYYIGYNRVSGMNRDSTEDANKVTILRKDLGKPDQYGLSTKVAALSPGQVYTIQGFNNERDLTITFYSISDDLRDATIKIGEALPPPPCEDYTVEFLADGYPGDNSWTIREKGTGVVHKISPLYTEKNKLHKTKACLPYGKRFIFQMVDTFKDGLTNPVEGWYRVRDPNNKELFAGGNYPFHMEEKEIVSGPAPPTPSPVPQPTPKPTPKPTPESECKNFTGKFIVKRNKKKGCKWVQKKNKCKKLVNNVRLEKKCPVTCKLCTPKK